MTEQGRSSPGAVARRVLGSHALLFVTVSVVQKGMGLLLLPFFASALQPAGYGQVSILVTVSVAVTTIASLGLEMAVFRSVFTTGGGARSPETATLSTLLLVFPPLMTGAVAGLVLVGDWSVPPVDSGPVALTVLAAGLAVAATTAPLAVLRATGCIGSYVRLALFVTALAAVARLLAVVGMQGGVWGWAIADVTSAALAMVVSLRWQAGHLTRHPRRADAEAGLRFGLPLIPHQIAHWGLSLADRLVLGAIAGGAVVGVYAVGYQIGLAAQLVVTELSRAAMPAYGEVARGDRSWASLRHVVEGKILSSAAVCGLVAVWGGPVVSIVLPASYEAARSYVPWVCLGAFFVSLYYVPMNLLSLVAGRTNFVWAASGIAVAANLLLNVALIPKLGALAAAINTALGYGVLLVLLSYLARRELTSLGRLAAHSLRDCGLLLTVTVTVILLASELSLVAEVFSAALGSAVILGLVARRYSSQRIIRVRRGL
jgi:O-antigen/teichoic acid export membrane protein